MTELGQRAEFEKLRKLQYRLEKTEKTEQKQKRQEDAAWDQHKLKPVEKQRKSRKKAAKANP